MKTIGIVGSRRRNTCDDTIKKFKKMHPNCQCIELENGK